MATYNGTQITANSGLTSAASQRMFPGPEAANMIAFYDTITCTAALSTTDTGNLFVVPKGFRVLGAVLWASDMDTGGPTITINVGDAGSAARFFSASTVAQAGTSAAMTATTGLGFLFTADTVIVAVAQANATTPAAGTLSLSMWGRFEGPVS